jgi:hypothetical protein
MYNLLKSYTATAAITPKSVFATDKGALGIVDDTDTVDSYAVGDEVPVIVEGLAKLSAKTKAYDSTSGTWVATPAKEGNVLFYDGTDVKIDNGTAKSYQIIGKVVRVLDTDLYEIRI